LDTVNHTPYKDDVTERIEALEATSEPVSISLDNICQAQAADDNLQLVILLLKDQAKLFDDMISRVSVPSAILADRGSKFTREVMECVYKRLGITHLKTPVYHMQTDAKCECDHFSVHNVVNKTRRWQA